MLVPGHVSNRHAGTYGPLMPAEASRARVMHQVGASISCSVEQVKSQSWFTKLELSLLLKYCPQCPHALPRISGIGGANVSSNDLGHDSSRKLLQVVKPVPKDQLSLTLPSLKLCSGKVNYHSWTSLLDFPSVSSFYFHFLSLYI